MTVYLIREQPPFANAWFEKGDLRNWMSEGRVFADQPVFLIENTSKKRFYVNTSIIMKRGDYIKGSPVEENPYASGK